MSDFERVPSPVPPRPRGRPRAIEPKGSISVRLPSAYYDRIFDLAKRHDQSISATVRQLLILRLK